MPDRGADSNPGVLSDRRFTAYVCTGRNMHAIRQMAIMIDRGPGIDDAAEAEIRAGIDDRAGDHDGTIAKLGTRTHPGRRVP